MIAAPQEGLARFQGGAGEKLRLSEKRIAITGSSGWLGMAALEMLSSALGSDFGRRVVCFGSSERGLRLRSGAQVIQRPLAELSRLVSAPTLVLHLAYLTRDKISQMSAAEYGAVNRSLSLRVLDALAPIGAQAIFIPSSGAVYSALRSPDDPQSAYGALKLEDEERFAAWAKGTGKSAVLTRVFNISGPYINKRSTYALASFIVDALQGRRIEIRAERPVIRSFVAVDELLSLAFQLMLEAPPSIWRFDTAGEELEVGELAARVEEALTLGTKTRTVKPRLLRLQEPDRYVGMGEPYAELCSKAGIRRKGIREQILETARFIEAETQAEPVASERPPVSVPQN